MSDEEKPLQRITELTICGEKYELAANGQGYLVAKTGKDAYGNPVPARINIQDWIKRVEIHEAGCFAGANEALEFNGEERRNSCTCKPTSIGEHIGPSIFDVQAKIQSLIDHLVAAHRQLQTSRDARLGVGKQEE